MSGEVIDVGAAVAEPVRGRARAWLRASLLFLAVVLVGLVVGGVTAAVRDLSAYTSALEGRILPGASIAGVDVGGRTPAEALAAVEDEIGPALDRRIALTRGEQRWDTSPRDLGATDDAEAAVAAALAAGPERGWLEMARLKWQDEAISFSRDVAITRPDEGARAWVESIAAAVDATPTDARMDYSDGWVTIQPEQAGTAVDVQASTAAVLDLLDGAGDEAALAFESVPAAVTTEEFRQVLLLRQDEYKLYLYQDGEIVREWLVTTGTGAYPTPRGEFYVSLKRHMPTWGNPSPDGWGANMPRTIGPGPNNPLGVRALNWSTPDGGATAIRFHGTNAVNLLGGDGSHGCVRLSNPEVIELYDLVDEGAKIVSL